MIESRLDPSLDGLSHLAKVNEHTVAEIAELFHIISQEGHARSVASVLRIVAEQCKGRQAYPGGPIGLMIFTNIFTPSLLLYFPSAEPPYRERQQAALCVILLINIVLASIIWKCHKRSRRYRAQIVEIRRLAMEALKVIVSHHNFAPKSLDKPDLKTFGKLRGIDRKSWSEIAAAMSLEAE